MNNQARIGFAGTPEFASTILGRLIAGGYVPVVVYSQPDRPKGRGRKLLPSPVKALALANDIAVETPRSLRAPEAQEIFANYQLDLLIVAAYGLILPQPVLDAPAHGCVNVHSSLLPRWRGAAPVERAIMAGDTETGVALMQMEAGLDTGPVYRSATTPITQTTEASELEHTLATLGSDLLLALLPDIEQATATPQPEQGATYANKLTASDSEIRWQESAIEIHQQVRALRDRAPARSHCDDLTLQILTAEPLSDPANAAPGTIIALNKRGLFIATGTGQLQVTGAQINRGKGKPMRAADLANGYAEVLVAGMVLTPRTGVEQ